MHNLIWDAIRRQEMGCERSRRLTHSGLPGLLFAHLLQPPIPRTIACNGAGQWVLHLGVFSPRYIQEAI